MDTVSSNAIHCPRCHSQHSRREYFEASANGTLPQLCYDALIKRIETNITEMQALANEAYKRGDTMAVWEMGARIKDLERQKAGMRKP